MLGIASAKTLSIMEISIFFLVFKHKRRENNTESEKQCKKISAKVVALSMKRYQDIKAW